MVGTRRRPGRAAVVLLLFGTGLLAASAARAVDSFDGRLRVHGWVGAELRGLSTNFDPDTWYPSQLALAAELEVELDLLRDGWGPFDTASAFVRTQLRFDCIWYDGCGLFETAQRFGDDAGYAPSERLTDGRRRAKNGLFPAAIPTRVHDGKRLVPFYSTPPFDPLLAFSPEGGNLEATLAPIDVVPLAAYKRIEGAFDEEGYILAPWNRRAEITSLGSLRSVPSSLGPDLPLRPLSPPPDAAAPLTEPQGLWVPNAWLRKKMDDIDDTGEGFNLRERELRWNRGDSQQRGEYELKEAYLDLELFDARLFLRLGKQIIVWGKTELFRSQDQFNPQDVGLSSLPRLEDSRIALWAARMIYSFYDVGPFQDVRLELAAIVDEFQPIDAGTCGEPYSVFLVCAASNGFFAHSYSGLGIAGVDYPSNPWDDIRGLEFGGRLEWRWRRFSFALTDFYGYDDVPTANRFHSYERKVDVETGQPLDVMGRPFDFAHPEKLRDQALNYSPLNRQLFEFACAVSVGVAGQFVPELAQDCVGSLFNNNIPLADAAPLTLGLTDVFASVLNGTVFPGAYILDQIAQLGLTFEEQANLLVLLNRDPNDGTQLDTSLFCYTGTGGVCLGDRLTDAQEALLGCGHFYGTDCDRDGIDLFQTEASVIFQTLPQFEPGGPVATRYERGKLFILPGARGPGDPGYDPRFDGCVSPKSHPDCAAAMELVNPVTGRTFHSEMEALSFNLLRLLAAFGSRDDPECRLEEPYSCAFVRAIFDLTGVGRPELRAGGNGRFGRRDFLWARGGPLLLEFDRRNVFGFSTDFDEDYTKTSWSLEFTWFQGATVPDDQRESLFREQDIFNLSISVDRPTFVNFLNANRTILFNAQVFLQYVGGGRTVRDRDPLQVLGTFTVFTGYFQDRLVSQLTFVHDLRSTSGGVIFDLTWRFTSNFSATLGFQTFYGGPQLADDPTTYPTAIGNNGPPYSNRGRWDGLSLLRDRDEASFRLRYTF